MTIRFVQMKGVDVCDVIRELQAKYRWRRVVRITMPDGPLRMPKIEEAADVFGNLFAAEVVEVAGLLCLSTRLHVLSYHELSRGTLDATIMPPATC